jgi:hypothetical protein
MSALWVVHFRADEERPTIVSVHRTAGGAAEELRKSKAMEIEDFRRFFQMSQDEYLKKYTWESAEVQTIDLFEWYDQEPFHGFMAKYDTIDYKKVGIMMHKRRPYRAVLGAECLKAIIYASGIDRDNFDFEVYPKILEVRE